MSSIRWRCSCSGIRWHTVGSQSVDCCTRGTKNQLDLVINLRPILNRFVFFRFSFYVWQVMLGGGKSASSAAAAASLATDIIPSRAVERNWGINANFTSFIFSYRSAKWRRKFIRCVYHGEKSEESKGKRDHSTGLLLAMFEYRKETLRKAHKHSSMHIYIGGCVNLTVSLSLYLY